MKQVAAFIVFPVGKLWIAKQLFFYLLLTTCAAMSMSNDMKKTYSMNSLVLNISSLLCL